MSLKGKDIIRTTDYTKEDFERIFDLTDEFAPNWRTEKRMLLEGKVLGWLFWQPSTRTQFLLQNGMVRLGGGTIGHSGAAGLSIEKGESFEDHIRIVDGFVDAIAMRHPDVNSAQRAADIASVPVLNCGNGRDEHPISIPYLLYPIRKFKGKIEGLNVVIMGDLLMQRCAHSMAYGLAIYGANIIYASPPELRMPEKVTEECKQKYNVKISEMELGDAVAAADAVFSLPIVEWAGVKELFKDYVDYYKVKSTYRIDKEFLKKYNAKDDLIYYTPGPRVEDVSEEMDRDPRFVYFAMWQHGVPVTMAYLSLILGALT